MKTDDSSSAGAPEAAAALTPPVTGALDWVRDRGDAEHLIADLERHLRERRKKRARVAVAGVTLALALGWGVLARRAAFTRPAVTPEMATVAVLRPARQTLPDGSIAELKGDARIEVQFVAAQRRVVLQKGVAHFQVAHDTQRPFIVVAGGVEVRAVGTAFVVELERAFVEVVVTDGTVAIEHPTASAAAPEALARVTRGWTARIDREPMEAAPLATPRVAELPAGEMSERLAWRVPRLEFAGTPLAQAIVMFNEHAASYRQRPLVLGDAALGALRVSGVLRVDNPESLLRLLEGEFGLATESRADAIVIRRK